MIQTCDHAVGASHTRMTASAAMMTITTAMKVLIYILDEPDVEESFSPDTLISNVIDVTILI